MTKIIALCGASASGKSMLCSKFLEQNSRTHYIVTTTTKVRETFDNPSYEFLCSLLGNSLMHKYQTAIADNLWNELIEAFSIAQDHPDKYKYIILDRSPLDAYIYEELFGAIADDSKVLSSKRGMSHVAFRAFTRLFNEYNDRNIERTYPQQLHIVGLTSLFPSNDPKRPKHEINQKYANEVRRIFNLGSVSNYPLLKLQKLSNIRLDIEGRVKLLKNLLQEDYNEDANTTERSK